jgi:soluble lytic murein transglycosylase-like protein
MQPDLSTIAARKQLAGKWAAKYSLDTSLVCAVATHESSWNPWACRYEPLFFSHYIQPLINNGTVHTITEGTMRASSFGLLQVLGQVARENGFSGQFLTQLCDPDTGLDFGCRKLQKCVLAHPGDTRAALLAYNGGGDPQYPDLVLQFQATYT